MKMKKKKQRNDEKKSAQKFPAVDPEKKEGKEGNVCRISHEKFPAAFA